MDTNIFTERKRERESRRSPVVRGWSGGAMVLGELQCRGVPLIWIIVGQGPSAGWSCLDILSLVYLFSFLFPSLGDLPI